SCTFAVYYRYREQRPLHSFPTRRSSDLRRDVEEKIHRLPLSYFDRMPRGELLSRVTNDIDNVSQSLQQTLSQLLTSLLTVIGVRSEEHTSELQSRENLVCRLLLEKKKIK